MKKQLVEKILKKAKSAKIAVIGDFCLDVYWFVNEIADRIAILRQGELVGDHMIGEINREEVVKLMVQGNI